MNLTDAILLATEAHRGQKDYAGLAYITHPLRVMSSFVLPTEEDERIVAVLHDVVEDTKITLEMLKRHFAPNIIEAIDAITRRDKEAYKYYIQERVSVVRLATRVKLADLEDLLNPLRVSTALLWKTDPPRMHRYQDSQIYLEKCL